MGEQPGQPSVRFEIPTPETAKAAIPDVIKIGDSERRMPEEKRATGMVGATLEFLGDLGKANLAAKKELGELASTRVGKALAVGAVGGGLEYLSEAALGLALNMLLSKLPVGNQANIDQVKKLFGSSLGQEILADSAAYVMYEKGNEFLGKALPKIPSSYLGSSAMVNVLDWAARKGLKKPKDASFTIDVDTAEAKVGETEKKWFSANAVSPEGDASSPIKGLLPKVGFAVGKVADFSNPVTLFGATQVVEGVTAYLRAVSEIRTARKTGGEMKVDMLLAQAKKAKPIGVKRDKQERLLDLYEKAGQDE